MIQTLAIIKPDGVKRGLIGDVIKRIEEHGLRIVAMRMMLLSKERAEFFYAAHRGRKFYDSLTTFMSSGPCLAMVLLGENAIGQAAEGTIRRDFATDIQQNVVHGSDSEAAAIFEIGCFFNRFEISA
ncbi:MAG: nucleoside-diphosphate kinase [Desulfobacterales bacterium]|nr:nucleoside-diphosphate kinase [Desulfobacterales bacterium]